MMKLATFAASFFFLVQTFAFRTLAFTASALANIFFLNVIASVAVSIVVIDIGLNRVPRGLLSHNLAFLFYKPDLDTDQHRCNYQRYYSYVVLRSDSMNCRSIR